MSSEEPVKVASLLAQSRFRRQSAILMVCGGRVHPSELGVREVMLGQLLSPCRGTNGLHPPPPLSFRLSSDDCPDTFLIDHEIIF